MDAFEKNHGKTSIMACNPESLLIGLSMAFWFIMETGPLLLQWEVQRELSTHIWETALMALPMTLIILTGGIDLSIGSIMSLSAVTAGLLHQAAGPAGGLPGCHGRHGLWWFNGWFITGPRCTPDDYPGKHSSVRGMAEGVSRASTFWLSRKLYPMGNDAWLGPIAG